MADEGFGRADEESLRSDTGKSKDDGTPDELQGAFLSLGRAVLSFVKEPTRLKDKRARAVDASEALRNAFSLRPESLDEVPKQLDGNHLAAADYLYDQFDLWSASPEFQALFTLLNLDDAVRENVARAIMEKVNVEELAVWVCDEFGDLTATRRAIHSRRYIATRLSREIVDLTTLQSETSGVDVEKFQSRLDEWSNPAGSLESSLHYTMVIEPFLNAFETYAGGQRLY